MDTVVEDMRPTFLANGRTPEQLEAMDTEIRYHVTQVIIPQLRTMLSAASKKFMERDGRRVQAELQNLERYEASLVWEIKRREDAQRHDRQFAEMKRNSWVPRAAIGISLLSLLLSTYVALFK
ncbi:hypothetical protein D7X96_20330 [Corallococcus interemptor]|uniref:Uncharacterized protein n=1 Tax=Corallococcus interemptor TaxID=2316720 RepID=A0A3A8QV29_9BACT|nr:hypothetical protein D7X96_20330 [Corallococcus interemptor]